jgi:hypothetical protein
MLEAQARLFGIESQAGARRRAIGAGHASHLGVRLRLTPHRRAGIGCDGDLGEQDRQHQPDGEPSAQGSVWIHAAKGTGSRCIAHGIHLLYRAPRLSKEQSLWFRTPEVPPLHLIGSKLVQHAGGNVWFTWLACSALGRPALAVTSGSGLSVRLYFGRRLLGAAMNESSRPIAVTRRLREPAAEKLPFWLTNQRNALVGPMKSSGFNGSPAVPKPLQPVPQQLHVNPTNLQAQHQCAGEWRNGGEEFVHRGANVGGGSLTLRTPATACAAGARWLDATGAIAAALTRVFPSLPLALND